MAMITIVGCGPGSVDYLSPIALRAISQAEVLVGAPRLLDMFPDLMAERVVVTSGITGLLDSLTPHAGVRKIAVLVTGDPGICSLAQHVVHRFGRDHCRIIPGISSVQVAFARLRVDWFGARLLSAHSRIPEIDAASLIHEEKIAVLAGNAATHSWVAALAQLTAATHKTFVCQDLTLPEEDVRSVPADELATMPLSSRTIVVFLKKEGLA